MNPGFRFLAVATSLIAQLTLIAVAAVVAPILAELTGRLAIPGTVMEIGLGILIGPQVLNWVPPTGLVLDFSNFGLALLMFLAGAELDPNLVHRFIGFMAEGHARDTARCS